MDINVIIFSLRPQCFCCSSSGPFASAIGKTWHPDHFICDGCGVSLQYQGFMEEGGKVYCEEDYNKYFAPHCAVCKQPIVGVSATVILSFTVSLQDRSLCIWNKPQIVKCCCGKGNSSYYS